MTTGEILRFLTLLPILLVSMMLHEVAHGWVANRLGDPTAQQAGRLTLNPLKHLDPIGTLFFVITYLSQSFVFGWAKPVPVNPYYFRDHQRGMMVVGLAGPATNFALGVLIALVLNVLHPSPGSFWFDVLFLAFQVNIVLGVFNLVPIPPLDGSRLLGGFLPPNAYDKWVQLDRYGMVFFFLMIFVFRGPFFSFLSTVYRGIAQVLLPSYF